MKSALLALLAGAAAWLAPAAAHAQMMHVDSNDWRQTDRHDVLQGSQAKPSFLVELRFGPYLPDIDSGVTGGTPFKDVFGYDCGTQTESSVTPRFAFGLEADYMAVRIPYVGAIGPGVGWSYTNFSALARDTKTPSICSGETTSLTIMPMHLSAVLRADELMRRTGIPIVPYGKFGVGMAWWRASDDFGTEQVCGTASATASCGGGAPVLSSGTGLTPSLHFALGGAIALNCLEPMTAARLDESTGVHHAYVFGEYYNDQLILSKNVMHVGVSSWVVGLAVDF